VPSSPGIIGINPGAARPKHYYVPADVKVTAVFQIPEERLSQEIITFGALLLLIILGLGFIKVTKMIILSISTHYKQLKMPTKERLLSNDYSNFVNWTHILDSRSGLET
jgi:hypothetical protein